MSLACGRRGGNVPVNRSKVVVWRTTAHSTHHTVRTNGKVLSLNPHGPPDWWVYNKKAACEEKFCRCPRAILSNLDTTLRWCHSDVAIGTIRGSVEGNSVG